MAYADDIRLLATPGNAPRSTLALVGVSHKSVALGVLEKAALDDVGVRTSLRALSAAPAIHEAAVLATCNRTEFILAAAPPVDDAVTAARAQLQAAGLSTAAGTYVRLGHDAATHLCRVAGGIDSLMVGEPQILGQVKSAQRLAEEEDAIGPQLSQLFAGAARAGKRARTETAIGTGAVSVSYAALALALKIFTDLRERRLLVIGAGETGALTARHFRDAGISHITIANRTSARAEAVAQTIGAEAVPLDGVARELQEADIVVTATSAGETLVTRALVEPVRERTSRPLVFIDISLPRNVDPQVNALEGVFLHDMSALETIVKRNLARRRQEIPAVEAIIAEEVERYARWEASLTASATVRVLRAYTESLRAAELARHQQKLSPETLEALEQVTKSFLAKLLHRPLTRLRQPRPGAVRPAELAAAVRELFELNPEDLDPQSSDDDA